MRNQRLVRIIAAILALLLVGGVIVGALIGALGEASAAQATPRSRCELVMHYLEDEQALRVEQRLVYVNRTGARLDRVRFGAAANMFRRRGALMYAAGDFDAVFPEGYAPGGIDLRSVRVDGAAADYGFEGEAELSLRVACDLAPGERCAFQFDYDLLLPRGNAFIGAGEADVRLSAFYFTPGVYRPAYGEFALNEPLPFTRWLHADAMDFDATLTLPDKYELATVGEASLEGGAWHISAGGAREFALSFGKRWRAETGEAGSGVSLRLLSATRDPKRVLRAAAAAIERCEAWFGAGSFPLRRLVIAQSDYPLDALNFPGLILLPSRLFERGSEEELVRRLRFCVAQQYFGLSAYVEPSADAWLSDSLCEYLSYLMLEAEEGRDAFLAAINRDWVSALQLTIPGGLTVTSEASLFDDREYDIVVRKRGAVVFHELREAMGLEAMLRGLAAFCELGRDGRTVTEMDLVACLDDASGRSWEAFLTDWTFNVGDYVNQTIDWFT